MMNSLWSIPSKILKTLVIISRTGPRNPRLSRLYNGKLLEHIRSNLFFTNFIHKPKLDSFTSNLPQLILINLASPETFIFNRFMSIECVATCIRSMDLSYSNRGISVNLLNNKTFQMSNSEFNLPSITFQADEQPITDVNQMEEAVKSGRGKQNQPQ